MFLPFRSAGYFVLLLSILWTSCKKRNDAQDCRVTVSALSGTYKIVSLTYKSGPSAQEMDFMAFLEDCEKDDQIKLNANLVYNTIDAGVSCDPSSNNQGSWNLVGNKIVSDGQIQGDIQSFDCNTLIVFTSGVLVPGDKVTFTFRKL